MTNWSSIRMEEWLLLVISMIFLPMASYQQTNETNLTLTTEEGPTQIINKTQRESASF